MRTYSSKARKTLFSMSAKCSPYSELDRLLLMIVGMIDLVRSNSAENDCNRNAKNASEANTLIGSKALKYNKKYLFVKFFD